MSRRARILSFGSAAVVVVIGAIAGIVIGGYTGAIIGSAIATLALGAIVVLVFLEIGLSEDRDRAEEERRRHPS